MISIYLSSPVSSYQRKYNSFVADLLKKSDHFIYLPQEISPQKISGIRLFPLCGNDSVQQSGIAPAALWAGLRMGGGLLQRNQQAFVYICWKT